MPLMVQGTMDPSMEPSIVQRIHRCIHVSFIGSIDGWIHRVMHGTMDPSIDGWVKDQSHLEVDFVIRSNSTIIFT